jgi:hypothetical protein
MVLTGRGNASGRPSYSGNLRCQAQFRCDLREWVKDPVTKKMVRDSPTGRPKVVRRVITVEEALKRAG